MLEAYQALAKQLEEKRQSELNPERTLEEKKAEQAIKVAATGTRAQGVGEVMRKSASALSKVLEP